MSPPSSDTSDSVLVSRPSSPAPLPASSLAKSSAAADAAAGGQGGAGFQRHDSPIPTPVVVSDTPHERTTVLAPSSQKNTTAGLGRAGAEQLDHLQAPPVLGEGAEGVVGKAQGRAPEYIATVRRTSGAEGDVPLPPDEVAGAVAPSSDVEGEDTVEGADDSGGKKQPRWLRKMKEGAASAASSLKEKAASVASSTHIPSVRERSDSNASSLLEPESAASAPFGRSRTRSIGAQSKVAFALDPASSAPTSSARSSLDVPRPAPLPRIVTDTDGRPVPVEVGTNLEGGTPTSSTREGLVPPQGGAGGANVSTTTSVRDKILESGYEVEPRTTHEKFHSIFKDLPEDEELIEDYRCALVRDILVQGKLYVSESYVSFRSNIFGWETTLKIPWSEIVAIEKRMTAKVIPNAIEIRTLHATHTFASFVTRDSSYSLLVAIWRHVHGPAEVDRLRAESRQAAKDERARRRAISVSSVRSATTDSEDEKSVTDDDKSEISFEDERGQKKRHKFKKSVSAALRSIKGRDTAADDGTAAPSSSTATTGGGPTEAEKVKAQARAADGDVHAPTTYDGPEYKNVALDCVLPTTPYKAFILVCGIDKAFMQGFLENKEHLREVEIGPWRALSGSDAEADDSHALKQRDMSYIKPLNAPVGPKQTHCNIHDENEKLDEESYISNLTTTKTPDVPSGNDFSTVTRTVLTWAEGGGCRVRVTTEVEWTKVNRWLRGVIEKGAIDGQKSYHSDLEASIREYIAAHPDEYGVVGGPPASERAAPSATTASTAGAPSAGAEKPSTGLLSFSPLPLDQLALVLLVLVGALALSNLYTFSSLRSQAASAARTRVGQPGEIASAVSRVLGEFNALHARRLEGVEGASGAVGELGELRGVVKGLEATLEGVMKELVGAVKVVREVADRTEGVRDLL
ncbi:hypothetical protein JCM6882_007607 [Rhodosporidiobolus microsporus]